MCSLCPLKDHAGRFMFVIHLTILACGLLKNAAQSRFGIKMVFFKLEF